MTKDTLQKHYDFLRRTYDDYYFASQKSKNARLKKDRDKASKDQSNILGVFEGYIKRNPDLYKFLSRDNQMDNTFFWDEFLSHAWFSRDLSDALGKLENAIKERN